MPQCQEGVGGMKDMIIKNDVKYRVAEYALFRLTEEGILLPQQYE